MGAGLARGRRRKTGVIRDRKGKSRGEPEIIDPRSLEVRGRDLRADGIDPGQAKNALAGFSLGRLRLIGMAAERTGEPDARGISQEQLDAGERWAALCRERSALMGFRTGIKSPGFGLVAGGLSCASEPDPEYVAKVRRRWSDGYRALMQTGMSHGVGSRVAGIVYEICVESRPLGQFSEADFGYLRLGLNALGRVL